MALEEERKRYQNGEAVIIRKSVLAMIIVSGWFLIAFAVIVIAVSLLVNVGQWLASFLETSGAFVGFINNLLRILGAIFLFYSIGSGIFRWRTTYYELIGKNLIIHTFLKERTVKLDVPEAITASQSLMGKIFNYGDIRIAFPVIRATTELKDIPNPRQYQEFLKEMLPQLDSLFGPQGNPVSVGQRQQIEESAAIIAGAVNAGATRDDIPEITRASGESYEEIANRATEP